MRDERTSRRRIGVGAVIVMAAVMFWLIAVFGGSLEPPGVPAPTMRALDEVEPRIPIGVLPYTITAPGSYYVTRNLNGTAGSHGITILADNVTIDLMGFTLSGGPGSLSGISSAISPRVVSVRNGIVRDWGQAGVSMDPVFSGVFEGLQAYANGTHGIYVRGENNVIRRSHVEYSVHSGIHLASQGGSAAGAIIENCSVMNSGTHGIYVTSNAFVRHNQIYNNGSAGLFVDGTKNRIEANNIVGSQGGLGSGGVVVDEAGNLLIRNSASGNLPVNYQIAAGNVVDGNYEY